ncbi:MAG: efflux RND transporter permease subunit, partial [Cyclobacteriaceae bacterium]|nr:efflux RND transporter permease subunit [Cyclobacteriaceae bacterium]
MRFSSFTIITLFIVFTILGLLLVPKVPLRLKPSRASRSITVTFNWNNASSEIIEGQATSLLEGIFSTISGLTKITSRSTDGHGEIQLTFDKTSDMEAVRFEISTLIRQARPDLPEGIGWPVIRDGNTGEDDKTILTYTLNGNDPPYVLQKFAEENLKPLFGNIKGISNINVYGATPREWVLTYDQALLNSLGIGKNDLSAALSNHFQSVEMGVSRSGERNETMLPVKLTGQRGKEVPWDKIPVTRTGDRIVWLTDLCEAHYQEMLPAGYFRINGLNTVNIVLSAGKEENELVLGKKIKEIVTAYPLPPAYNLLISYDSTTFLQDEIDTILFRSILSFFILVLFTLLVSMSVRYLLLVMTCILVNLAVAFAIYYLFGIELHLYSLAGITISLGIIIDNTFVMIDHVSHQGNRNVFIAILAATLTTIGALSVIFFLEETQKLTLIDFALVLMINLSVSLGVSLFLAPALLEKFPLKKKKLSRRTVRVSRWSVKLGHVYQKGACYIIRYKKTVVTLFILGFGLPLFLLPDTLKKDSWYKAAYNGTLGHEWYRQNIHPFLNTWLGGTMTLFKNNVYNRSYYGEPEQTTLYYRGRMPNGTTIQQMNEVFLDLENFLSQFDEIKTFQTRILGPQNAGISIYFKKEHENTWFPYFLKSRLEDKAIAMGGLDSQVYGVGRGFSNALYSGYKNSRIYLYGYHYETLLKEADALKKRLLRHARIKEVLINPEATWNTQPLFEYVFSFDHELLARNNTSLTVPYRVMNEWSIADTEAAGAFINDEYTKIRLRPLQASSLDLWNIRQFPMNVDERPFKLGQIATITRQRSGAAIYREDQQYRLVVEYDYIGSPVLQQKVIEQNVEETNALLPLGYLAKQQSWSGYGREAVNKQYLLVFLVVGIIFILGAVLLESLKKALVVVFMVPLSFIGVFLTFYWFNLNFDQGGYASFLLLSGLVV